ncbi:MAG: hypothetical protein EBU90_13340 [Proteobacteria bacterium]|nr:hypothetical protein [Pseudomonadota bacterium]NBP15117.1 hypothetical protein [bacterium]
MTSKKPRLFNKEFQKEWSEEYSYKHIHTGEYCTFEAYLAEFLILRWTEAFKMDKPSYKFWTVGDKYHDMFIRNMKAAKSLKKKFEEKIILEAVKSRYFDKIYHIGLKCYGPRGWKYNQLAVKAIENYKKEIKAVNKSKEIEKTANEIDIVQNIKDIRTRRTQSIIKTKSMINKLRDL